MSGFIFEASFEAAQTFNEIEIRALGGGSIGSARTSRGCATPPGRKNDNATLFIQIIDAAGNWLEHPDATGVSPLEWFVTGRDEIGMMVLKRGFSKPVEINGFVSINKKSG